MKNEVIDLIKYRLEKSRNTLLDAKKYIKETTTESAVNRIYYAMFYAVNALLMTNRPSTREFLVSLIGKSSTKDCSKKS